MRKSLLRMTLAMGLASMAAAHGLAQSTPPAPPPLPAESSQFDFWIGDWNVFDPQGNMVGENLIQKLARGSGLLENWTGLPQPAGGSGKSLNAYNSNRKCWQQFWVGSGGGVIQLNGGLVGDRMVLSGETTLAGGKAGTNRITWTPNADGTVRQLWEQSADGGKTWQVAFDGLYKRKLPQ